MKRIGNVSDRIPYSSFTYSKMTTRTISLTVQIFENKVKLDLKHKNIIFLKQQKSK